MAVGDGLLADLSRPGLVASPLLQSDPQVAEWPELLPPLQSPPLLLELPLCLSRKVVIFRRGHVGWQQ